MHYKRLLGKWFERYILPLNITRTAVVDQDAIRQAIKELIKMAQFYYQRGHHEKAREVMNLVERMQRGQQENVISLAN